CSQTPGTVSASGNCSYTMPSVSGTYEFRLFGDAILATSAPVTVTGGGPVAAGASYVSPSGSDSNPGTLSQPFRTVQQGLSVLAPGKTLYLGAGTYVEGILLFNPTAGTADQRITIAGYPGDAAPTVRPPASWANHAVQLTGSYWIDSYYTLKDFNI